MQVDLQFLKKKANELRKDILIMLEKSASGHPGGSLSAIDILTVLFYKVMKYDSKNPDWDDRDFFILSKGHACPALYSVMADVGYFSKEELGKLRQLGAMLQGHPSVLKTPGIETSSGPLGQGISAAVGIALSLKLDKKANQVYCMLGDGESQEGQVWEAVMAAGHYGLDNLCAIVDANNLQIDGNVQDVMNVYPLIDKYKAFHWHTIDIYGHNFDEIVNAFDLRKTYHGKPTVIIAHTLKGKGVSFMENQVGWHGKAPDKEDLEKALKELGA